MTGQPPTDADSIRDGKLWLRQQLKKGAHCPLCGQRAQMYHRKINSGMARSLIHMYRIAGPHPDRWIHVSQIGAKSREEGKLVHWGLLEEQKAVGLHGGRAGYWRLTQKGLDFVQGKTTVHSHVFIYDGRFYGFDGSQVTIKDALGAKFDYNELLNGA